MDDHASSSDCAEDNSLAGRAGEKGCAGERATVAGRGSESLDAVSAQRSRDGQLSAGVRLATGLAGRQGHRATVKIFARWVSTLTEGKFHASLLQTRKMSGLEVDLALALPSGQAWAPAADGVEAFALSRRCLCLTGCDTRTI